MSTALVATNTGDTGRLDVLAQEIRQHEADAWALAGTAEAEMIQPTTTSTTVFALIHGATLGGDALGIDGPWTARLQVTRRPLQRP